LREFKKWDLGIFPQSQNFKISWSSHPENDHIKLNGFQSIFGGWGDTPFILDGEIRPKSGGAHLRTPLVLVSTSVRAVEYLASCRHT